MRPAWLLTTRLRTAVAVGLTTFMLALAIRDELRPSHGEPLWPLFHGLLHGWFAIALNVAFYGYFCWLAYWFICRSKGWERIFFAGWLGPFLLSPLKVLHTEWAASVRHVETFGKALSLLVALSFLLKAPPGQLNIRDQMDV